MRSSIPNWFLLAVLMILPACAPNPAQPTAIPTAKSATPAACLPSKIQHSPNAFPEIQGTMDSDGELWALLFFDKAQAGKELKIVWRMTGGGDLFRVQARHEDGTTISPSWGPEYHNSSSWQRPGLEWGTGFNFPRAGCWALTATLGPTVGRIFLDVGAP